MNEILQNSTDRFRTLLWTPLKDIPSTTKQLQEASHDILNHCCNGPTFLPLLINDKILDFRGLTQHVEQHGH